MISGQLYPSRDMYVALPG